MVCVNTIHNPRSLKKSSPELEIKHVVDIEGTKSFIATARNTDTNRLKVYFISTDERIYERQGLRGIWQEIENDSRILLKNSIKQALESNRVPRYTTNTIVTLN